MKKHYLLGTLLLVGCSLTGCTIEKTAEVYGLSHGGSYVCRVTATFTDDELTGATLQEVCFPTHVEATAETPDADKVAVQVTSKGKTSTKNYYKSFSYGELNFVFDVNAGDYVAGGKKFAEMMKEEANCKAYFDAVIENGIKVSVGGEQKADILCKHSLDKDENGYWTKQDGDGNDYSRWQLNRDASIEFLLANGIEACKASVKNTDKFWANGDAVSGATWNDFNSDTTDKGYFSYVQLLEKAIELAK